FRAHCRKSYLHQNHVLGRRRKFHHALQRGSLCRTHGFAQSFAIRKNLRARKRPRKSHRKVNVPPLSPFLHATTTSHCVWLRDVQFRRQHVCMHSVGRIDRSVLQIHNKMARRISRKRVPVHSYAFCRRQFRFDSVIPQQNRVVARLSVFVTVRKSRSVSRLRV